MLVATPVKLLSRPNDCIQFHPANFICCPGHFVLFQLDGNLLAKEESGEVKADDASEASSLQPGLGQALIGGPAASALTLFLGNLGTIQLIYQKMEQLGAAVHLPGIPPFPPSND